MKKIFVDLKYPKDKSAKGYILNVSEVGMGIAASKRIKEDTLIKIIPKTDLAHLRGKVIFAVKWKKKLYSYRLGIRLVPLEKGDDQDSTLSYLIRETRKYPRMDVSLRIVSRIDRNSQQKFSLAAGKNFKINAVDISRLGMGFIAKYFLPSGLIIELRIDGTFFSLRKIMTIKGEIRYCRYLKPSVYRCGVRLLSIPPKYEKAIRQFISMHERRRKTRMKILD